MSWDSDALRKPTTAQTQTLCVIAILNIESLARINIIPSAPSLLIFLLLAIAHLVSCSNNNKLLIVEHGYFGVIELIKDNSTEVVTAGNHYVNRQDRVYIYPIEDTLISSIKVKDKEDLNYVVKFRTTYSVDKDQLKQLHLNYKDTYKQLFVRILVEGKLRTASQTLQSGQMNQEFIDSFLTKSFISSEDRSMQFSVESFDIINIQPLETEELKTKRLNPWLFAVLDTVYKTSLQADIYCYKLTEDSGGNEGGESNMRFIISRSGHKIDSMDFYLASWGEWSSRDSKIYFNEDMILINVTKRGYSPRYDSINGLTISERPIEQEYFVFQVDKNLKFQGLQVTDELFTQFVKLKADIE